MPQNYPFTLAVSHDGPVQDVTALVQKMDWSGSATQVGRTLEVTTVYAPKDKNVEVVVPDIGDSVELRTQDGVLFSGTVLARSRNASDVLMSFTAYDMGLWLKETEVCARCQNRTPEEYAAEVAAALGLTVGQLAETGVKLSRNFLPASYYEQIRTLYALAAEQTGGKYQIRLAGRELSVVDVTRPTSLLRLDAGVNLLELQTKENAAGAVSRVEIYDEDLKVVKTVESEGRYGVFTKAIRAKSHKDAEGAAEAMLREAATSFRATCFGHPLLIAGNSVIVREPITGTFGQLFIKSDRMSWSEGRFTAKLELDFSAVVDDKTAGEAVDDG